MVMARHTKSIQNNMLTVSLQYLKKELSYIKLMFYTLINMKSLLQVDSIIFMCVARYAQSTSINLQYLCDILTWKSVNWDLTWKSLHRLVQILLLRRISIWWISVLQMTYFTGECFLLLKKMKYGLFVKPHVSKKANHNKKYWKLKTFLISKAATRCFL